MILNCTIFFKFSWGSMPPNPPSKGHDFTIMWQCTAYCFDTCKFTFQKIILTPYQILYTSLLAYMYKLIKNIKYKF